MGIYSHNLSLQGYKGNYGYKFVPSRCIAFLYSIAIHSYLESMHHTSTTAMVHTQLQLQVRSQALFTQTQEANAL